MKTLIFHGVVNTGIGKHANLVIPGRNAFPNAPPDWPKILQPGSLNILIDDNGYPSEFAQLQPNKKVENLDSKQFQPAFTIPYDRMQNNKLKPCTEMPEKGTAQVWRATLHVKVNAVSHLAWVHRRLGSGIDKQLELVSDIHLRNTLSLKDGMEIKVELQYEEN